MPLNFDKYAIKGNEFVRLVAEELQVPLDKAGRIIRTVFHTLRNRLSHEESFQLLAQLPMAMKGVYVDGWKFEKDAHRINYLDDFLEEVRHEDGRLAAYDFGDNIRTKHVVATVFKTLNYFVSEGEMNDILAVMPVELKAFIKESIGGHKLAL